MTKPNLDFIYENISPTEFERMLCAISQKNNTLFFALYDNAPNTLKPSLSERGEFIQLLCSRVESLSDKEFNGWFFDNNLKKFYDVYEVRELSNKKPKNIDLKDYLQVIDKPKTTEELLKALWHYKGSDKYHELIELNKHRLLAINDKELKEQNPIGKVLFGWMRELNFNAKMKLAEDIGLDIIKIACRSESNLQIDIQKISLENLKSIWQKIPDDDIKYKIKKLDKSLFVYKNTNFGYFDKLIDILENKKHPERIEKAQFIFDNLLDYFESYLKVKKSQIKINMMAILESPNKELEDLLLNRFLGNLLEIQVYGQGGYSDKFKEKLIEYKTDFFVLINPLYNDLHKNLEVKNPKKTVKI